MVLSNFYTQLPPLGVCGMFSGSFFTDDGIPPMTFYRNLKAVARSVTSEEVETTVTAIYDFDIKDEDRIEEGDAVEHVDKDHETEDESIKVFMFCGASGIIYRSIAYQSSTTLPVELQEKYSATNGLVTHLCSRIPDHHGHKYFRSGDNTKVVAVCWYDKKVVNMASNFIGIEPQDEVRRWDKKKDHVM
ncbi:hypothetical protein ILUMI_13527, partial [Ignelater luminosus]